jgi:hypothetical protein
VFHHRFYFVANETTAIDDLQYHINVPHLIAHLRKDILRDGHATTQTRNVYSTSYFIAIKKNGGETLILKKRVRFPPRADFLLNRFVLGTAGVLLSRILSLIAFGTIRP